MPVGQGITISWPMMALAFALMLSVVTGAIQLGGVQTHVVINTERLNKLEATLPAVERSLSQADAAQVSNTNGVKVKQEAYETRVDELLRIGRERLLVIEQTRPTAGELQAVAKSTHEQIERILNRIDRLERRQP